MDKLCTIHNENITEVCFKTGCSHPCICQKCENHPESHKSDTKLIADLLKNKEWSKEYSTEQANLVNKLEDIKATKSKAINYYKNMASIITNKIVSLLNSQLEVFSEKADEFITKSNTAKLFDKINQHLEVLKTFEFKSKSTLDDQINQVHIFIKQILPNVNQSIKLAQNSFTSYTIDEQKLAIFHKILIDLLNPLQLLEIFNFNMPLDAPSNCQFQDKNANECTAESSDVAKVHGQELSLESNITTSDFDNSNVFSSSICDNMCPTDALENYLNTTSYHLNNYIDFLTSDTTAATSLIIAANNKILINEIKNLNIKIASLEGEVVDLIETKNSQSSKIDLHNYTITQLQIYNEDLNNEIKELNSKIANLVNAITTCYTTSAKCSDHKNATVEIQKSNSDEEIHDTNKCIKTSNNDLLTACSVEHATFITNQDIDLMSSNSRKLNDQLTELNVKIGTLNNEISNFTAGKNGLTKYIDQLEVNNSNLNNQINQFTNIVTNLNSPILSFTAATNSLKTQVTQFEASNNNLNNKTNEFSTLISTLNNPTSVIASASNSLKAQITQLETNSNNLTSKTNQFATYIANLNNQNSSITAAVNSLNTQIGKIQTNNPSTFNNNKCGSMQNDLYYCKGRSNGCSSSGTVWGTDMYTSDSNKCLAALHSGFIGNGGGLVLIRTSAGLSSYTGSTRNGVTTREYGQWGGSFYFQAT